jgi:tripartite-type tricarboxylate transporter receptor subunit TctC
MTAHVRFPPKATIGPGCAANSLWRSFYQEVANREDHMLRHFAVLVLVLLASPAAAQDSWPSKPVTVIVPFGAGGNTDALARIYSARLSVRLGQQFVIENRVGAGSIIGITSLAKAAPDGYTIGVGTSAGLAINPAIMKENLGYNADKDFAYLHLMAIQPNVLVVHPSVPARSLPEFIAWVKANPDQAYATSGNGSSQHLCGEMLMQAAGIKMNGVAYRASNQQMQDLVGGQIRIACDNFSSAWEQVQAGKIRAVAITSAKRYSFAPDIPTIAETLKKDFEVQAWFGWIAPIGVPKVIIDKLTAELNGIGEEVDVRKRLDTFTVEFSGLSGQAFADFARKERETLAHIIEKANIKLN